MKKMLKLQLICTALLMSGCAGTNFEKLNDSQFVLGVDTAESIKQKLGKPYSEGAVTKNDKQFKTMSYAYASATGEAVYKGVTAARSQGFYFNENRLVGHQFTSSWSADATDFDESKVSQIKKGVTTIQEVIQLLGSPSGQYIYPLVSKEDEKAKVYVFSQTKGSAFNLKMYQKALTVSYNQDDVVTKIDYAESGSK